MPNPTKLEEAKSAREIIEQACLEYTGEIFNEETDRKILDQALADLRGLIPAEKEVSIEYYKHNNNLTQEAKEANALNLGFNIAITETHRAFGGEG
jgi:hypothetical protein